MGALHFPETILVETIHTGSRSLCCRPSWTGAPLARYHELSRPQKIEFSRKECAKLDRPTLEFVVWHELGHWFRVNHIKPREIKERFLILGAPNAEEGFADAFASHFLLSDEPLDSRYPRQREALKEFLVDYNEGEVRSFADLVIEKLSTQLRTT